MLTLVGVQLVPLVEVLSTALMVTLKENNKSKGEPVHHHSKPQTTFNKIKKTSGLLYSISLLLVLVNSSHVVLHAGICDKGLGASVSQTPGDHSR